MNFPVLPLAIQLGVGGIDGFVASTDASAGRTAISKQRTLWVQLGAIAAGLVGEFAGLHPDITEPLYGTGAALLSRELAFKMAQSGQASPATPQGYTAWLQQPQAQPAAAGFLGTPLPKSAVA